MERDAVAELELPRRVVDLRRQRGRKTGSELTLGVPGQQRLVDVVVDRPFAAVVDHVRVEARRLDPSAIVIDAPATGAPVVPGLAWVPSVGLSVGLVVVLSSSLPHAATIDPRRSAHQ